MSTILDVGIGHVLQRVARSSIPLEPLEYLPDYCPVVISDEIQLLELRNTESITSETIEVHRGLVKTFVTTIAKKLPTLSHDHGFHYLPKICLDGFIFQESFTNYHIGEKSVRTSWLYFSLVSQTSVV